ncbi:hypothetical protein V7S43_005280 [Phytophthora oleae]|uniref:Uncharacterized protein n=1 Tax=Phytophthora oleae TaxID=2107226 RepID=A0ABD3FVA2_9STRA
MAWWYGVFSACMVIIISAKLQREQFVANPARQVNVEGPTVPEARKLKLTQCIRKLIRPASPFLLLGAIGAIGSDFGIQSVMPESWRPAKLFLYIAAFWGFFSMVILDVYARRIFQTETIRGIIACSTKTKTSYRPREIQKLRRHTQYWIPSFRRFLYVYRQNLPVVIFTMISIVYVHVVSRFINSAGQWGLFALSSASIALKLMLQE